MTDPSPEERAYQLGILLPLQLDAETLVANAIRQAVLAETERIIQIIWHHRQKAKWELWKSGLVAEIRRDPSQS